ncbi:wall-associated receptor kinase 2-like [Papaver somniferum]|nr:wall-associated receptor kinase 2-like [Papaver somniferum]
MSTSAAASFFQSKPGCETHCGNVTIPYPFGIAGGEGCSADGNGYGYSIRCDTSFYPAKPFIGDGKFEVISISETEIRVKNSRVAAACYTKKGVQIDLDPFSQDPTDRFSFFIDKTSFTFSNTKNRLFAIGCDTLTSFFAVSGNGTLHDPGVCLSLCNSRDEVIEGSCAEEKGCCQLEFPKGINSLYASVSSLDNHTKVWSFDPCSYAFIAEKDQYSFRASDLLPTTNFIGEKRNIPFVLDWVIGNKTCEEAKDTLLCQKNSVCVETTDVPGYRCTCVEGYEGNPYLSPGCQAKQLTTPGPQADTNRCGRDCFAKKQEFPILKATLGIGLGILLLIVGISCLYLSLRKRKQTKLKQKFYEQNGGLLLNKNATASGGDGAGAELLTKIYTAKELELATNNFHKNRILGEGGYGVVYKGILPDNREVAIKKSKAVDESQIEQFINEVVILTRVNHRNVVKLLGFCLESKVPLLVYEYVPNGTLFQHIHCKGEISPILSWESRLRIATETANAIAYLHYAVSTSVIHRDIKSSNILLDENFTAKVSDFGASRLIPLDKTRIMTIVQGTFGYLDPEYFHTSQLTEKSDVYSFGVVLIELLTGEQPVSLKRSEEQRNLATFFIIQMEEEENILQILDAQLVHEGNLEKMLAVAELAKRCLFLKSVERPTMKQVVAELEYLRNLPSQEEKLWSIPSTPIDLYMPESSDTISDFGQHSFATDNVISINTP